MISTARDFSQMYKEGMFIQPSFGEDLRIMEDSEDHYDPSVNFLLFIWLPSLAS